MADLGYCAFDGSDLAYECYYPKERRYWNGWACPLGLTKKSFLAFMREQIKFARLDDFSMDFFIDCCNNARIVIINCGDEDETTLYSVEDLGLCWNECDKHGKTKGAEYNEKQNTNK